MKILRSFIFMLAALFSFSLCACAEDFIFKYKENAPVPYSLRFEQSHVADSFYATDDEETLKYMLEAGIIEYYEPNVVFTLADAANDPEYVPQSQYEFLQTNALWVVNNGKYNGKGVKVGIIDTGLADGMADIDYTKIVARRNVTVDTSSQQYLALSQEEQQLMLSDVVDNHGHGTSVAGIIAAQTDNGVGVASLAPDVNLVIIKAFEGNQSGMIEMIRGLKYAIEQGCDVVNLSFGAIYNKNQSMEDVINEAEKAGMIVVAAAGNHSLSSTDQYYYGKYLDKDSPLMYPAAYHNAVSVASIGQNGGYSSFSYHNKGVNIAACGSSVKVLNRNDSLSLKSSTNSGTSFACPFVASVAALAKQVRPDITTAEFIQLISETATDRGEPGWDTYYGSGIINVGKIMDELVGMDIEVSQIYMDEQDFPCARIINNGFGSQTVMDIWFAQAGDMRFDQAVNTVTIEPRASVTVKYDVNYFTVLHTVWHKASLMPLSKKEVYNTGIIM